MSRTARHGRGGYFWRYHGHKMWLKEGQERKYGSRQGVRTQLVNVRKEVMATFNDWLGRTKELPVEYNRLFTRLLFFYIRDDDKAVEVMLRMCVDGLHMFNTYDDANGALIDAVEWAEDQDLNVRDEATIAKMAKQFYSASNITP